MTTSAERHELVKSMMPDHAGVWGLQRVREIWRRRKWVAVLAFTPVLTAVVCAAKALPNIYKSTATVLVERHRVPETFVKTSVTDELETRLQTISQEVLSRSRLAALVAQFNLYPDLTKHARLDTVTDQMRRDIQLELKSADQTTGRATIAFTLSYRGRDPQTVAQVTNAITALYVAENVKRREQQAAGTAAFLRTQLAEAKKRLDTEEQRVREFRTRYTGELPQQTAVNLATLERLHAQLHLSSANQLRAMDRRTALMKELAELDPGNSGEAPDAAGARLAKLKQDLVELRQTFSDRYPDVIRTKAEIAALERRLATATPDQKAEGSVSPATRRLKAALADIEAEIGSLKAEERKLRQDIAAYQRRVENAPEREQEFKEVSRDYDTARDLYNSLLKRSEDAELAETMEQKQQGEQFRVLDPAIPTVQPAAPNRRSLVLVGFVLALGVAVGAVLLAEHLDTSFHTVDNLRTFLGLPVLVTIPLIVTDDDRRRWRRRFWLVAASAVLALALVAKASQYFAHGNEQLVSLLARGGS